MPIRSADRKMIASDLPDAIIWFPHESCFIVTDEMRLALLWMAGKFRTFLQQRSSLRSQLSAAQRVDVLSRRILLAAPNPLALSSLDGTNGFRLDGIDADDESGRFLAKRVSRPSIAFAVSTSL